MADVVSQGGVVVHEALVADEALVVDVEPGAGPLVVGEPAVAEDPGSGSGC
ncbi:MAG: hypothetical protein M3519_11055 [Actinomycetota bacterium]|nr:hypothetical protein [Actinomycetota bacterium]